MSKNNEFFKVNSNHYFFLWRFALRLFYACASLPCVFSFFTTWHNFLLIKVSNYLTATFSLTPFIKIFAGLNAGILWAGIITAVFLEILRPVFSSCFDNKTTKTSKINVFSTFKRTFYLFHKFFNCCLYVSFADSQLL